jgi:hypothetical protein
MTHKGSRTINVNECLKEVCEAILSLSNDGGPVRNERAGISTKVSFGQWNTWINPTHTPGGEDHRCFDIGRKAA